MNFRAAGLLSAILTIPLLMVVIANDKTYAPLPVLAAVSSVPAFLFLAAWSRTRGISALRVMAIHLATFLCLMSIFFAGGQLLKLDLPVAVPIVYILGCVAVYWVLLGFFERRLE